MRAPISILVVAAVSQIGATDCGSALRDPGFDLWCGDQLCAWKVVRGDARRVPTWHDGDSGVELLGADAAIAQLSPVNSGDGTCIRFELVANVSEDAEARLDVDIYGDNSVELSERMPTASWKPLSYKIRIDAPYTGVKFELTKRGPGTAVFAQIAARVVPADECDGLAEIAGGPAPLGAACVDDAGCASGLCRVVPDPSALFGVAQVCVGCDPNAPACGADVCGRAEPASPVFAVPVTCVTAASDELGEQCITGAECASGICATGMCSACNSASDCTGGEQCAAAWPGGPLVCGAGAGSNGSGEPCAADADCASGHCNGGVRNSCEDGRPCATDANCPVDDGLIPGACTAVGIQGGSCA